MSEEFIRNILAQLRQTKKAYVFNTEQVNEIKKTYPDLHVINDKGIYMISINKK